MIKMKFVKFPIIFLVVFCFFLFSFNKVEAALPKLHIFPQLSNIWCDNLNNGDLTVIVEKNGVESVYEFGYFEGREAGFSPPMLNVFETEFDNIMTNIEPGDIVTLSIGESSVSYEVLDGLKVTEVDFINNVVKGIGRSDGVGLGDPFVEGQVYVGLSEDFLGFMNSTKVVQVDSEGFWEADFDGDYNIVPGTTIFISQGDVNGNITSFTDTVSFEHFLKGIVGPLLVNLGDVTSNIVTVFEDSSEDLYFESSNFGKITFSAFSMQKLLVPDPVRLLMFENPENWVEIIYDDESNEINVSVDTQTLDFLEEYSAVIEFFDVADKLGIEGLTNENFREFLDIVVIDNGQKVSEIADYFDWDNVVYNVETDVLTLPVNHFTKYVLGEAVVEEEVVEEITVEEDEETEEVVDEVDDVDEDEKLADTGMGILLTFLVGTFSLLSYVILRYRLV